MSETGLVLERGRISEVLAALERMAGGDALGRAPISGAQDELDAISHGINVMAGELHFRVVELQKAQSNLVQSGKLAALGEVSSGLAHELNNPLTIIRGYVEMASEVLQAGAAITEEDHATLVRCLERIDGNVERMGAIIRHFMDFSRQTRHKREPVCLAQVIDKSFILLNEQLRLKNIRVEKGPGAEELFAWGDELRLEQVLINLLTNARDAILEARGETGGSIQVLATLESPKEVRILVRDDGIGMTDDVRANIFNPFFTTKGVGLGTGLGLSISLGIIQEHGGSIACRSVRGQGAEFAVQLPRWVPE